MQTIKTIRAVVNPLNGVTRKNVFHWRFVPLSDMQPLVTIIILSPLYAMCWFITGRFKWFVLGCVFCGLLQFHTVYWFLGACAVIAIAAVRDEGLRENFARAIRSKILDHQEDITLGRTGLPQHFREDHIYRMELAIDEMARQLLRNL